MRKVFTSIVVLLSVAILSLSLPVLADIPSASTAPDDTIPATHTPHEEAKVWNLQDADILSVINEVSLETGKNFAVDPRVSGKISLVSSKPIKANEVYDVFLSILELLGYSAIPGENVVKIVPNLESTEMASRVANAAYPGKGDEVVVRVIPLENVSATQVVPVLRPLLPQWSNLSVYSPGNVLIVAGRAANIERILHIVQNIDKASNNDIDVVRLNRASASQVAAVLSNLQTAGRATGEVPQVSVAADERSNSILLSGNRAARVHLHELVEQLDKPTGGQGNTDVVYLRYLQAKTFAPVLGKIAQNLLNGNTNTPQGSNASNTTAPTTGTKTPAENFTNIQAEPSTNSLIITAPPTLMQTLKAVVAKLDIRPAQVLVEAVVVEIDQTDLNSMGIQWGGLQTANSLQAGPGFQPFGLGTIGIIPSTQVQAVLNFLQTQTSANILSTPSVVVLDNHKATLEVGQDVPFQSGSYASTGAAATVTPFNTTNYLNVTLKLDVIPQINLGNSVRLTLRLQNDTLANPSNPGPTPLTNISRIQNSVIVDSADILVLGGLISNNLTDTVNKLPVLGDIPIIGNAFTYKTRQLAKKNLVVFIKPVIMHNMEEADSITNTKYDVTRKAQINWPVDLSKPGVQKTENILSPWKNDKSIPQPFQD